MRGNKFDKNFLRWSLVLNLLLVLPIICRKPPIKDWLLVYLFNAVTNGILDSFLSAYNIIQYPVRFLPKVFKTHILFDFLVYPTFTIIYNQITRKDKPFAIFYKLLFFTIPMTLIELWAVRKTKLIKWKKEWKWYHSFIGFTVKSLITRLFIGVVRKVERKQKRKQKISV